jgi:flagellar biosynthesis anti-sigma factor FlgM
MDVKFNAIQAVSPVKKYQSAQRTAAASYSAAAAAQTSDKVDFSDSGKLFAQAMKQAIAASEVREDRVAMLRESIQNGTYAPDAKDIARKMLSSLSI